MEKWQKDERVQALKVELAGSRAKADQEYRNLIVADIKAHGGSVDKAEKATKQ